MAKAFELRQERFRIAQDAKGIIKAAEGRALTADEQKKWDAMMAEVTRLGTEITTTEKEEEQRKLIEQIASDTPRSETTAVTLRPELKDEQRGFVPKGYALVGMDRIGAGDVDTPEYRKAFGRFLSNGRTEGLKQSESRALQADLSTAGGYTVVPQTFVAELIEAIKVQSVMRGRSRAFLAPNAESLGAPSLDNRPADPTWTSEILTGNEDSTMSFGKRELRPVPLAQLLKVSKKLIRQSALGVEELVRNQLAYKLGYIEDYAFLNGSGAGQPLGIFTASALGVDTSRDVSTGNTATEIRADGLLEAKFKLRPAYWPGACWIFHQDALKQISKLRGSDGNFLWQPGLQAGKPDVLLGIPVVLSELAPNTFTTGLYVGSLCNCYYYWIADALDMSIQVLTELYAATNQNGYISRKETDGMPVLAEAFVRVTLA